VFKATSALLAGSIILIGAIRRVQTIGTAEFVVTVRVTVFLFAAFAIGLFVVDADTAFTLASQLVPGREHTDQGISWMTLLFFSLLPVVYRIVEGARFTEAWKHAFDGLLVCLLVLIATILVHNVGESALGVQAMQALWLVGGAVVLGFAHAVFGPVLAAFNLSLIVASVIGAGVFSVSLFNVFEWLGHLGIYSEPLKWILLAGSTALGLHGTVSQTSLRDLMPGTWSTS